MDKELDVLIKGITSKYYTEYLKAIYKPNENARLPKAIKNSDAYKQIKENLRKTYTNEKSIINAQFGTIILAEVLSELLEEFADKENERE